MENIATDLDSTITHVEKLYRSLTGQEAPPTEGLPYGTIPPEQDVHRYVEEQIDRLVQALDITVRQVPGRPAFEPPTSMWEGTDAYLVCMDLPGVPKASIEVSIGRDAIEVRGDRPRPGEALAVMNPMWLERPAGPFLRSIALPPDAKPGDVVAQLRDGVLEIRIPRSAGTRSVTVK